MPFVEVWKLQSTENELFLPMPNTNSDALGYSLQGFPTFFVPLETLTSLKLNILNIENKMHSITKALSYLEVQLLK